MKSYLKAPKELRNGFKDKERLAKIAAMSCIACDKADLKQLFRTEVHHLIGCGIVNKSEAFFPIPLCSFHHRLGNKGEAIHETPLHEWEEKFWTQEDLIELTNKMLESA